MPLNIPVLTFSERVIHVFDCAWLTVTYGTYCHIEYVETSLGSDVAFVSEALFVCLNLQLQVVHVMRSLISFPTYMRSLDCRIVVLVFLLISTHISAM